MYLYLVQGTVRGWDTYDSFVCAAPSAEAARRIHPGGNAVWSEELRHWTVDGKRVHWGSWDHDIATVIVELLGKSTLDRPQGVICTSFVAG